MWFQEFRPRHARQPSRKPRPTSPAVPGSGVLVAMEPAQPAVTVLESSVTAPVSAMTPPQESVALVFIVTFWSAIIFPRNAVVVPRVAELPTTQYTLSFVPGLMIATLDALAVVRVLPIW